MKKFLIKLFLVLLPIFLIVISVNYFGDAAKLFSTDYEKNLSDEIIKGNNITNVTNYDERLLQKFLIHNSTFCPDVLVLGSSRVMLINSTYFKGQTFFNNGVSGASIEDLLSIYQMYDGKKCQPKKIILGLDPWTLNINNNQTRWTTLTPEYYLLYNKLTNRNVIPQNEFINLKFLQLISPSYFKNSFKSMFLDSDKPIITTSKINNTFTKCADGSISYDLKYRSATLNEIEKKAISFISGDIYSIEKFDKLSPEIIFLLENFIKHLKTKHIEISFFLAPYHPKVYSFIAKSKKYRQVIDSENYFRNLGKKYGIPVVGSYNPDKLNMSNSYFYDGMHCNENGIKVILDSKL